MENLTQGLTLETLPKAFTKFANEVSEIKRMLLEMSNEKPTQQSEKLYSIKEASEFLNLSVPTIYSKVSRNELPFMKQGGKLYFSSFELMQFIKDGKRKTNAEIEAEAVDYLNKNKGGKKC